MSKNILLVHASPRSGGNSSILADWFERGALEAGNEVTRVEVGHANISGCMACEYCFSHDGACVQDDDMQKFYPLLHEADVIVYATPMYFYNFPAQLRAFQDRMFCGVTKPFGITATALLLCFEDKDVSTCDPVVDSYRVAANYCKQENLGEVIVNNVYEKGAIEGNPAAEGLRARPEHQVDGEKTMDDMPASILSWPIRPPAMARVHRRHAGPSASSRRRSPAGGQPRFLPASKWTPLS